MREGKPSKRFGARGLHAVYLGDFNHPMIYKLYDADDNVLATLTEEQGDCVDEGWVDGFNENNCRPSLYRHRLVEQLPDGTANILHNDPKALALDFDKWVAFLDDFVTRNERKIS